MYFQGKIICNSIECKFLVSRRTQMACVRDQGTEEKILTYEWPEETAGNSILKESIITKIISVNKSKRFIWARYVSQMEKMRNR
jgi:hypothetical protein